MEAEQPGEMEKAVEAFLADAGDRLTAADEPMVQGLRLLAKQLDRSFLAATFAQYGLTYRHLQKRLDRGSGGPADPLEEFLED